MPSNILPLFLCPIEANIGSEDSSLSDALVLDDGNDNMTFSYCTFIVMVVMLFEVKYESFGLFLCFR